MKQIILIAMISLFCFQGNILAQSTAFNYQGIAVDFNDQIIANKPIGLKVELLDFNGVIKYEEEHLINTSARGIFNIKIGEGMSLQGDINQINWKQGDFKIRIWLDATNTGNYVSMGAVQLLPVPFAMHAETVTQVDDADADPQNEIQTLSKIGNMVSLSKNGGFFEDLVNDADADPNNEIETWTTLAGIPDDIKDGDDVDDADADPQNELQALSITGNQLSISGGNTISIPTGGTDGDADPNNEIQDLSSSKNGNVVTVNISGGQSANVNVKDGDADPSNEIQALSITGNQLSISNGNTISIPTGGTDADADPQNELQDLSSTKSGDLVTLNISNGISTTVNVKDGDCDDTNEIQILSRNGNMVSLSSGGGNFEDKINDADADPQNEIQNLSISGNQLSISGGNSISIPTGGTDADADPQNEIQDLTAIKNNQIIDLSISGGQGASLDIQDADADPQNEIQSLSLNGNNLSLSNSNTLSLGSLASPWVDNGNNGIEYTGSFAEIKDNASNLLEMGPSYLELQNTVSTFSLGANYAIMNSGSGSSHAESNWTPGFINFNYDLASSSFEASGLNCLNDRYDMILNPSGLLIQEDISDLDVLKLNLSPDSLNMFNNASWKNVFLGTDTDQLAGTLRLSTGTGLEDYFKVGIQDDYSWSYGTEMFFGNQGGQGEGFYFASEPDFASYMEVRGKYGAHVTLGSTLDRGYLVVQDTFSFDKAGMYVDFYEQGNVWAEGSIHTIDYENYLGAQMTGDGIQSKTLTIGLSPNDPLDPWLSKAEMYIDEGFDSRLDIDRVDVIKDLWVGNDAKSGRDISTVQNVEMYDSPSGNTIWYSAIAGPEAAVYTRGTGILNYGQAFVAFPEHFVAVMDASTLTVSITPLSSDTYGLAVTEKTEYGFYVSELAGGEGIFEFDWEVKAQRKDQPDFQVIQE